MGVKQKLGIMVSCFRCGSEEFNLFYDEQDQIFIICKACDENMFIVMAGNDFLKQVEKAFVEEELDAIAEEKIN